MDFAMLFIPLVSLILSVGIVGFTAAAEAPADDVDCPRPIGPLDEIPPGCYKICETYPIWWFWGSHQDCYYDDQPEVNP